MADISALYAQPQQNNGGQSALLSDPIGTARGIMGIQALRGQRAAGSAMLGAMRPDGTFDPSAAVSAAQGNPDAAWAGSQFSKDVLANRYADTENAIAGINRETTGNNALAGYLSGFAGKDLTDDDVHTIRANAVKLGGNPHVWGHITDKNGMKNAINNARVAAAGAANGAAPTTGEPTPDLAPTTETMAERSRKAGPQVVGITPTQDAETKEYLGDQTKTSDLLAGIRPVQAALPLIEKLNDTTNFGPGSAGFTRLKATLENLGIIAPGTSDANVRQEAGKYLKQNVTQTKGAGRSDEALGALFASNPDADTMLKGATLSTIKRKIGMDRMDAALPLAAGGAKGYKTYKSQFYNSNDVRAFYFDLMDPKERRETLKSLGPEDSVEHQRFTNSYNLAKKLKYLHSPQDLESLLSASGASKSGGPR